jgi:FkbM family methyltransferase
MQIRGRIHTLRSALKRRLGSFFRSNPERFLRKVSGVIHVGANTGQEIKLYAEHSLSVIWIEPIPDVFEKLKRNLTGFHGQIALEGLVTDRDNVEYQFHLASNDGASSSILELNLHKDIWPDVSFEKTIKLYSRTLPSLLKENQIDPAGYDMLIIDTQGSELLVLKGAEPMLNHFKFIQTEVPDFEAYKDCCQLKDLKAFLGHHGFREISRNLFATHPGGGSYYDITFQKRSR